MSLEEIEKRQQLVEAFVNDTELRQTMQEEHLRSIPDLYRLAKRFQRRLANLEDVVRAYQVVIRIPGFIQALENVMDEQYRDPLEAEYTSKLRVSLHHGSSACSKSADPIRNARIAWRSSRRWSKPPSTSMPWTDMNSSSSPNLTTVSGSYGRNWTGLSMRWRWSITRSAMI
jgi:hypothetical protein